MQSRRSISVVTDRRILSSGQPYFDLNRWLDQVVETLEGTIETDKALFDTDSLFDKIYQQMEANRHRIDDIDGICLLYIIHGQEQPDPDDVYLNVAIPCPTKPVHLETLVNENEYARNITQGYLQGCLLWICDTEEGGATIYIEFPNHEEVL